MSSSDVAKNSSPLPLDDERTAWLLRYEAWLRLLARHEIDSRFAGKFDASDAVQQTLLEAWKDWGKFRGSAEPERQAWLRQILAHQLAHLARHFAGTHMRDVSREVSIDQSLDASSQRLNSLLPSADPSPSSMAAANEQRLKLAQALERLPSDYRQVILLRNLEDLPHAEVARRMERSEGAVRMLWVRALTALKDAVHSDITCARAPAARAELPGDEASIRRVHESAFPSRAEADLVDALRRAGRLSVSLVALLEEQIVGHVAFSPVDVGGIEGCLGLAPVAVVPKLQRRGIGTLLVHRGLEECSRCGAGFVVVLGEPAYYSRFGFLAASRWKLSDEYGGGSAFQALELIPGTIPPVAGLVRYSPEFAQAFPKP